MQDTEQTKRDKRWVQTDEVLEACKQVVAYRNAITQLERSVRHYRQDLAKAEQEAADLMREYDIPSCELDQDKVKFVRSNTGQLVTYNTEDE